MRAQNATDLGIDLDHLTSRRDEGSWIYISGGPGWKMEDEAMARAGLVPCDACGGEPERDSRGGSRKIYCEKCDKTSHDMRISFPGLDVDERPDPDWLAEGTCYVPPDDLPGGIDARPRRKKSAKRKRGRKTAGC